MSKEQMIFSQLINRGISDSLILNAFEKVDRDDFVPFKDRRCSHSDIEISIGDNRVVVRAFILAKIIERILLLQPENILVLGDATGYSASVFQQIFKNVALGTFQNSEIENLREKVKDVKVSLVEDLKLKFDAVFLDGGFFKKETVKKIRKLINFNGCLFYFSRPPSFEFSKKQFDFFEVSVLMDRESKTELIFKMPLYFPCETFG